MTKDQAKEAVKRLAVCWACSSIMLVYWTDLGLHYLTGYYLEWNSPGHLLLTLILMWILERYEPINSRIAA